jgi:hypothetical protein
LVLADLDVDRGDVTSSGGEVSLRRAFLGADA